MTTDTMDCPICLGSSARVRLENDLVQCRECRCVFKEVEGGWILERKPQEMITAEEISSKLDQILDLLKPKEQAYRLVKKLPEELHLVKKLILQVDIREGFNRGVIYVPTIANIEGFVRAVSPHVSNLFHRVRDAGGWTLEFGCSNAAGVFKVAYLMDWEVDHCLVKDDGERIRDPQLIYSILKNYLGKL